MAVKKNQVVRVEITGTGSDGSGVGHADGMAVFVPRAAQGDILDALIVKAHKNYAFGKIQRILSPCAQRIEQDCPAFMQCGGCALRHISYEAECAVKQQMVADAFQRIGGLPLVPNPIIPAKKIHRYRNKAQYPFGMNSQGEITAGFYARHSHRIIPAGDCLLHPEEFSRILSAVLKWAGEYRISAYDERIKTGLLRHLYLRKAFATGEILVVLVVNALELPYTDKLVETLKKETGEALAGVVLNHNGKDTNVVLGERCKTLYGKASIQDILCGLTVTVSPLSFYQVNRDMAEVLYAQAARYAKPAGKRVLDLYCGTGIIGLSMAGQAERVVGVEIVPQAVADAVDNAKRNGISNADFLCETAENAAVRLKKQGFSPEVVILDPPRKGCAKELVETVANGFCPKEVVYVSCNPATLARDLKWFGEFGYLASEATPVDLFPRTPHVECVVLMSRKDG